MEDYLKKNMNFRERRRFKRHMLDNPLMYKFNEEDEFKPTHTIDASEGGLMFLSKEDLTPGVKVNIQMPLDGKAYDIKARIARVVYDESISQYRVGVEFTDYTDSFRLDLKMKLLNILLATTIFSSMLFSSVKAHAEVEIHPVTRELPTAETPPLMTFNDAYSDEALVKLVENGAKCVSISVTRFQDNSNSTTIKSTELTPSDKEIKHVIKKAKKLGLKVLLKPRISIIDNFDGSYTSADIGFSSEEDWGAWFIEYEKFIKHYAKIARKLKVDIFCIGTQLSFTTQRDDKWSKLISTVRSAYKGKLVYAASEDNFRYVPFWRDLDLIGIEANANQQDQLPSIETLIGLWDKWHSVIDALQLTFNKPVILTNWVI